MTDERMGRMLVLVLVTMTKITIFNIQYSIWNMQFTIFNMQSPICNPLDKDLFHNRDSTSTLAILLRLTFIVKLIPLFLVVMRVDIHFEIDLN